MSTVCKNTGLRQELPCINCKCESSDSSAELGFLPPYKYGEECGKLERVWTERDMHAFAEQQVAAERGRICAAIKAADDKAMEGDYMLDSDDCIKVARGEWHREDPPNNTTTNAPDGRSFDRPVRPDGWYWVRKEGWYGETPGWTLAEWQQSCMAWYSTTYSGIPDSGILEHGPAVLPPNTQITHPPSDPKPARPDHRP